MKKIFLSMLAVVLGLGASAGHAEAKAIKYQDPKIGDVSFCNINPSVGGAGLAAGIFGVGLDAATVAGTFVLAPIGGVLLLATAGSHLPYCQEKAKELGLVEVK